jgi:hypothetical protein
MIFFAFVEIDIESIIGIIKIIFRWIVNGYQ